MDIKRGGSQPSRKGQAEYFTGAVRVDPHCQAIDPSRVNASSVTFEPGARTAWHTHPLDQILIVTFGSGWVQREGGSIEVVKAADVVWFPPRREALAWRDSGNRDDTYRHHGRAGRQDRRLDGEGER